MPDATLDTKQGRSGRTGAPVPMFQHQLEGKEFLKDRKKAILADEMGLGKTRQAIVAAGEDSDAGILVVCPASLKVNWQREINAVYDGDDVFVGSGTIDPEDVGSAAWLIVNYDILEKNKDWIVEWMEQGKLDTVIGDELHYIKGKSIRAQAFLEVAGHAKRVYGLTGTPMLNRPIELFNPLRAIGHPLGKNRSHYAKRFCNAHLVRLYGRSWVDESGSSNLDELRAELKPYMLRRKKKDVLDLPPKIVTVLDCQMTDEQRAEYDGAWDAYIHWVKNNAPEKDLGNLVLAQQLVELQKLKQVCSRAKVDRIIRDAKNAIEQGEKVIIFSQYTETIKRLAEGMRHTTPDGRSKLPAYQCVTLTGADDQKARQEAVDRFQGSDKVKAFIANLKAGGVGLTLTEATIVMFADMDWSPEQHSQAEDRAHRIGQGGTVNIYYYVCTDTIEEDVMTILDEKKKIIEEVLDGTARRVKNVSMTEDLVRRVHGRLSPQS